MQFELGHLNGNQLQSVLTEQSKKERSEGRGRVRGGHEARGYISSQRNHKGVKERGGESDTQ